jgi:hypothetical protein
LQRPTLDALSQSAEEMSSAIRALEHVEQRARSATPAAAQKLTMEVEAIRCEVAKAQALLENAGKFLEGWARLLGADQKPAAPNYTARGAAPAVVPIDASRVVMHG